MKKVSTSLMVALTGLTLITATPAFAKENGRENENKGLHLGELKKGKLIKNKNNVSSSTLAYRAAVLKAQTDYLAALKAARAAFLAAIQQARAQFLGNGNTTVTTTINTAPTIVTVATATPSTVTGTTSTLSVLASDDQGENNLSYSWSTVVTPSGIASPTFSINNSNAAKSTIVTFKGAGAYQFAVTITDQNGLSIISTVNVTVNPILTSVQVSPATATVHASSTQQFAAASADQFGNLFSSVFGWSILEGAAGGSINSSGLYTAPTATGTFHVVATSNTDSTKTSSSTVTVIAP